MNDWDTIEKMVNTLPQWDVIKLIIGIQEELKCAKEDNLYQLRQNKNLQNRIDKAIELLKEKVKVIPFDENGEGGGLELTDYDIQDLLDILKESGE